MEWQKSWDLTSIPLALMKSEWGRRSNALRKSFKGGPKEIIRECKVCGARVNAVSMRKCHGPRKCGKQ